MYSSRVPRSARHRTRGLRVIDQVVHRPLHYARVAGVLYLLLFLLGPFSFFYVPSVVLAPGDPSATLANLVAHESTFRWGMAAESFIFLTEIVLSVLLFALLRPVNPFLALMALLARVMQSTLQGANLFVSSAALLLAGGSVGFADGQTASLAMLALQTHESGVLVTQFFFGFHCLLLGYLLYKAGYFPKLLGILMTFAAAGYLIDSYGNLLEPRYAEVYAMVVAVPAVLAELSLTLWLLIKGVNMTKWREAVATGQSVSAPAP
jgi:hypothetical protein